MRKLSILRHAKSDRNDPTLPDFDRPLAPRGEKAAPLMGRHMHDIGLKPDLVLCSSAVRTCETGRLALAEMKISPPVLFDETIYEATEATLRNRLRRLDPAVRHVLLIGHNPGLADLIVALTGRAMPDEFAHLRDKLPTGALVVLELDIGEWPELRKGSGRITHVATPRGLAGH